MAVAVNSSIAVSLDTTKQASAAARPADAATTQLAATADASRREVQSLQTDLFERRIFDPYLDFRSAEDEREYRGREEERRRYIAQQLAAKTPEGDLNAAGATMGQMLDAHSHGAGRSPEFQARWDRLEETTRKHRDAMRAEGHSTDEFDRNLSASVRRYLHDRGLSDAEIEAKLAVAASPLDAVKPYLKTDGDVRQLSESANFVGRLLATQDVSVAAAVPDPPASSTSAVQNPEKAPAVPTLDDVMSKFKSAGVVPAADTRDEAPSHGVDSQRPREPGTLAPLP